MSDNGPGGLTGRRWWLATGLVLVLALLANVPTTGDIGLTWDEPLYRHSQMVSAQWWENLARARSTADLAALVDPDALLYYWPYARHGMNFHPPLAGQLNLLTYEAFGRWMKDIPARRMASVLEYSLTIAFLFGFLARRYGAWVGGVAAATLLLMPRVYGQGHLAETDTPGMFLWASTTLAFWKGLHEPRARGWRVLVGVLLGLAFVEKMGAVLVLMPLLLWLGAGHLPRALRKAGRADWIDGLVTTGAMLVPLAIAYLEIRRLAKLLPPPQFTNLFVHRPPSVLPGAILLVPLAVWIVRRLVGCLARRSPVWGAERPALETWTAILAFAPAVGWLGNPPWWRESLTRLAHYYVLSSARRGTLPDIQIVYFGQVYHYSLPWHNAWVLMAITVPAGILLASVVGLFYVLRHARRDRLSVFFVLNLVALPVARMFDTPGHDGVRLFLPSFFFLAALCGWGVVWTADGLSALFRSRPAWARAVLAAVVLAPALVHLVRVHPYELSYYNELIGGTRGAWRAGFELTYWYDAFNGPTMAEINRKLPTHAAMSFSSNLSEPPTFQDLQALGVLRGDIDLNNTDPYTPHYDWLLAHDAKSTAYSRLLFAMTPWYESRPRQVDHLPIAIVADPVAISRARALQLLLDAPDLSPPEPPAAPSWVRRYAPPLARLWGDGVTKARRLTINDDILRWAHDDPATLRAAAAELASGRKPPLTEPAQKLNRIFTRFDSPGRGPSPSRVLLRTRPRALPEAVEILIHHPDAIRRVMSRYLYTDPQWIGGPLDRDLP